MLFLKHWFPGWCAVPYVAVPNLMLIRRVSVLETECKPVSRISPSLVSHVLSFIFTSSRTLWLAATVFTWLDGKEDTWQFRRITWHVNDLLRLFTWHIKSCLHWVTWNVEQLRQSVTWHAYNLRLNPVCNFHREPKPLVYGFYSNLLALRLKFVFVGENRGNQCTTGWVFLWKLQTAVR